MNDSTQHLKAWPAGSIRDEGVFESVGPVTAAAFPVRQIWRQGAARNVGCRERGLQKLIKCRIHRQETCGHLIRPKLGFEAIPFRQCHRKKCDIAAVRRVPAKPKVRFRSGDSRESVELTKTIFAIELQLHINDPIAERELYK